MRTLTEIRRHLIAFYTSIQDRITDFSPGSVINGIFYAFSSSLEKLYRELNEVSRQAYIATATGEYLDRLIEGTFQLRRKKASRASGYVVIYSNSPLVNYADLGLKYAEFNRETGEFGAGTQSATKFVGYNVQGEEGVVFSLVNPLNKTVLLPNNNPSSTERLIHVDRPVQFLVLPVASMARGRKTNVREGGIYSFPDAPPGIAGVLNTSNPGAVFFSSNEAVSGVPFYSRFTEITGYKNSNSTFSVLNAFNFSGAGHLELTSDYRGTHEITGTYTDGTSSLSSGIVLEYISTTTTSITLSLPLDNSEGVLPAITTLEDGTVKTLTLETVEYRGVTYPITDTEDVKNFVEHVIQTDGGIRVQQRPDQVSPELIFDPDGVISSDYTMLSSATVGGGSDEDSDAEYRRTLRAYLSSLSKATPPAIEAGTLQIPGVDYAKTLSPKHSPRGSAVVLATGGTGTLPVGTVSLIKRELEKRWAAAGINVIVKLPEVISTNATVTVRVEAGTSHAAVYQQVRTTFEEYLDTLNPGDELRYSRLLTALSEIGGLMNVFNLVLSKEVTDDSYEKYKGNYDDHVFERVSINGIQKAVVTELGPPIEQGVMFDEDYNTTSDVDEAVGLVYSLEDADINASQAEVEVLEGDAAMLYNLYESLVTYGESTVEYFKNILGNYYEHLGADEHERMYFLSYVLSEPIEELPMENYPMAPDVIDYRVITDYEAAEVELFRPSVITIGTTPTPLVGIKFI